MDLIEQAIFTSAETDHGSGYHVVSASPGVVEADLRELAVWGPSHDSLLESGPHGLSIGFHALPSGASCVSRTTPSGWEYSGRGLRVYTQCLVVPPDVLARFANNPFALLKAATAHGSLRQYETVPRGLEPFRLPGRAAAVDAALLGRLCIHPGPLWLASLVQAALDSVTIALAGGPPAEQLVAGLLNCLPTECRPEFSFSTGLKFSSRRPFRVVAVSGHPEEQRRLERLYNVALLRMDDEPPAEFAPVEGWSRLIYRLLKSGRIALLAKQLSQPHPDFSPRDLPLLGLQLLEEIDASSLDQEAGEEGPAIGPGFLAGAEPAGAPARPDLDPPDAIAPDPSPGSGGQEPLPEPASPGGGRRSAHAPHLRFEKTAQSLPAFAGRPPAPSKQLDLGNHALLEKLERLDDLVLEAISGSDAAAEQLKALWPEIRRELDESLLADSREHYLRYALAVWSQLGQADGTRDPVRAAQSLEILCLLFDEG
jgi:hypothetical protein